MTRIWVYSHRLYYSVVQFGVQCELHTQECLLSIKALLDENVQSPLVDLNVGSRPGFAMWHVSRSTYAAHRNT